MELDVYIVATVLDHVGRLEAAERAAGRPSRRYAINLTPFSLLDPAFEAAALGARVRAAGLDPHHITIECTEQQSVPDIGALQRQVKALRKLGFGFAVDDAGAGYASFALIAALRPSVIKIDREIVHGIGHNDAKQALVEAFVSFGRRIGAHLLAEGIERRADLAALVSLNVELGQGYLLGRPERAAEAAAQDRDRCGHEARSRTIEGMSLRLPDHVRAFLDDERYATIATTDPDGTPRQAAVWYHARGRRDRHQQRRRPPLAVEPPARPADLARGRRRGRWLSLGRAERHGPRPSRTGRSRRPTSPAWPAATRRRNPATAKRTSPASRARSGSASGSRRPPSTTTSTHDALRAPALVATDRLGGLP